jgi:uncharacterized protein DUF6228
MRTVCVKSTRDSAELVLGPVRGDDEPWYYRAALNGPVVTGTVEVYDHNAADLAQFFGELGEQWWSGWAREKTYRSLEGHLTLVASRDSLGHVYLKVTLREGMGGPEWLASGMLELEAGQLPHVAAEMRAVFAKRATV